MKANELRLGNLILHNGKVTAVESVSLFYVNVGVHDDGLQINIEDCSPIPLTKEWLLKFGFVFLTDIGVYKLKFKIDTQAGEYEFAGVPKAIGFVSNRLFASGTIEYVHQLQNLYFALTGEELRI